MSLPDDPGSSLLLTAGTKVPFKASLNAGLIIWSILLAAQGSYVASNSTFPGPSRLKHATTAAIQFLSLSSGCWACLLLQSRLYAVPWTASGADLVVNLRPELIALSLAIPFVVVLPLFLVLKCIVSQHNDRSFIAITASGAILGMSVGFTPIILLWSTAQFSTAFNPIRLVLSLLLTVSASILAASTQCLQDENRLRKRACHTARLVITLAFGIVMAGASILFVSGVSFTSRETVALVSDRDASKSLDALTFGIPAAVAGLLLVVQFFFTCLAKPFNTSSPAQRHARVVLVSLTVSEDGRVLVSNQNTLFAREVTLIGEYKAFMKEFDIHGALFQWLFLLSRDWSLISDDMSEMARGPGTRTSKGGLRELFCRLRSHLPWSAIPVCPTRFMKLRVLSAAAALAADLDVPLAELGELHCGSLKIDSTNGCSEFLDLSGNVLQEFSADEAALQRTTAQSDGEGVMLFFVRTLPRPTSASVDNQSVKYSNGEMPSDRRKLEEYASQGYRLQLPSNRLRDSVSEVYRANAAHIEHILHSCVNKALGVGTLVLKAGGTHVSFFHERACVKGKEILVHESAQHQIPAYLVDCAPFTEEAQNWVEGMQGCTVSELLDVCRADLRWKPIEEAPSFTLFLFQKKLCNAIDKICRELAFVGRDKILRSVLSPRILRKPISYSGSGPKLASDNYGGHAWVITFVVRDERAAIPESVTPSNPRITASHTHTSSLPRTFTFIPSAIFDALQAVDNSREDRHGLGNFYANQTPYGPEDAATICPARDYQQRPLQGYASSTASMSRKQLVSSFSIDTEDGYGSGRLNILRRYLPSRIRQSPTLASVKSKLRVSLPSSKAPRSRSRARMEKLQPCPKSRNFSHQGSSSSFSSTTTTATLVSRNDYWCADVGGKGSSDYESQELEVFRDADANRAMRRGESKPVSSVEFPVTEPSVEDWTSTFTLPAASAVSLPPPAHVREHTHRWRDASCDDPFASYPVLPLDRVAGSTMTGWVDKNVSR